MRAFTHSWAGIMEHASLINCLDGGVLSCLIPPLRLQCPQGASHQLCIWVAQSLPGSMQQVYTYSGAASNAAGVYIVVLLGPKVLASTSMMLIGSYVLPDEEPE